MTEALKRWVNEELRLSRQITDFERDLANGYYIGEVMHRKGLQSDFVKFINSDSEDAWTNNFTRLEASLKSIGIKMTTRMANDIVDSQKGVAARLLVSIREATAPGQTPARKNAVAPLATAIASPTAPPIAASPQAKNSPAVAKGKEAAVAAAATAPAKAMLSPAVGAVGGLASVRSATKDAKAAAAAAANMKRPGSEGTLEALELIDDFEQRQKQLGGENDYGDGGLVAPGLAMGLGLGMGVAPPSGAAQLGPDQTAVSEFVTRARQRQKEDVAARAERDKRRRKALVEQERAQDEIERRRGESLLLDRVLKVGREERALAARLREKREWKEQARRNAIQHEQEVATERERAWAESLHKDAEAERRARAEYEERAAEERAKYQEYERRRLEAKHQRHQAICRRLLGDVASLALRVVEYKRLSDGTRPTARDLREWKALVVAGLPLSSEDAAAAQQSGALAVGAGDEQAAPDEPSLLKDDAQLTEQQMLLEEQELQQYLACEGDWAAADGKRVEVDYTLGAAVEHIRKLAVAQEAQNTIQVQPIAIAQHEPLCLALLGKPQAGKTTMSSYVAAKFGLRVLSFAPGAEMADVVAAIRAAQSENPGGWVLDGFPETAAQAAALEKELSGYEAPKPATPPNRRKRRSQVNAKQSVLTTAPPEPPKQPEPLVSALDAVVVLSLADEASMRRALGRRVDPVTGVEYHVEFDPARSDGSGVAGRLEGPRDADAGLQQRLTAFNEQDSRVREWYALFTNLSVVDADRAQELVLADIESTVAAAAERKAARKKEQEAKAAAANVSSNALLSVLSQSSVSLVGEGDKVAAQQQGQQAPPLAPQMSMIMQPVGQQKAQQAPPLAPQMSMIMQPVGQQQQSPQNAAAQGPAPTVVIPQAAEAFQHSLSMVTFAVPPGQGQAAAAAAQAAQQAQAQGAQGNAAFQHSLSMVTFAVPSQGKLAPEPPTPSMTAPLPVPMQENVSALTSELSGLLLGKWNDLEKRYLDSLWEAFAGLRRERAAALEHYARVRDDFAASLRRPPQGRQSLVDSFQRTFNGIEADMRADVDTKSELHLRTDELQDALWEMADHDREAADAERRALLSPQDDPWIEAHVTTAIALYVSLIHAEVDRQSEACTVLRDYFTGVRRASTGAAAGIEQLPALPATGAPDILRLVVTNAQAHGAPVRASSRAGTSKVRAGGPGTAAARGAPGGNAAAKKPAAPAQPAGRGKKGAKEEEASRAAVALSPLNQREDDALADLRAAVQQALAAADQATGNQAAPSPIAGAPAPGNAGAATAAATAAAAAANGPQGDTDALLLAEAIAEEGRILAHRVRVIKAAAEAHVRGMYARGDAIFAAMEQWLDRRHRAEMDSTAALIRHVREAIEGEQRLPYQLQARGGDFVVDTQTLLVELVRPPPPPPPVENTYELRFTASQLASLCAQLRTIAPLGNVYATDLVELLCRADYGTHNGDVGLPFGWQGLDRSIYARIASLFAFTDSANFSCPPHVVDWRLFLTTVGLVTPRPPTQYEFLSLVSEVNSLGISSRALPRETFMKLPFWFESDPNFWPQQMQQPEDIGEKPPAGTAGAPSAGVQYPQGQMPQPVPAEKQQEAVAHFATQLKDLCFEMFRGTGDTIDCEALLLHVCLHANAAEGLRRAFLAVNDRTPAGLYKIFNPFFIPVDESHPFVAAERENRMLFERDVERMMAELRKRFPDLDAGAEGALTYDRLFTLAAGREMLTDCQVYRIKDVLAPLRRQ
eukprot:m51a1_g9649 hypothetical protein (1744) ;mRNA; f:1177012-1182708